MPVTQYLVCCSQDILHLLARGQSKPTAPAENWEVVQILERVGRPVPEALRISAGFAGVNVDLVALLAERVQVAGAARQAVINRTRTPVA